MKLDVIWLAVCVVIAIANVFAAVANYWNAKRTRTMRSIERELRDLRSEVDALKPGSAGDRHYKCGYRNDESEDH